MLFVTRLDIIYLLRSFVTAVYGVEDGKPLEIFYIKLNSTFQVIALDVFREQNLTLMTYQL